MTDTYEDVVKAGVIYPAKVVRSALQNSSSIASLLLTTEACICDIPEDKKDSPAGMPGGGMGGMYLRTRRPSTRARCADHAKGPDWNPSGPLFVAR